VRMFQLGLNERVRPSRSSCRRSVKSVVLKRPPDGSLVCIWFPDLIGNQILSYRTVLWTSTSVAAPMRRRLGRFSGAAGIGAVLAFAREIDLEVILY
jgi:hypothetical protein